MWLCVCMRPCVLFTSHLYKYLRHISRGHYYLLYTGKYGQNKVNRHPIQWQTFLTVDLNVFAKEIKSNLSYKAVRYQQTMWLCSHHLSNTTSIVQRVYQGFAYISYISTTPNLVSHILTTSWFWCLRVAYRTIRLIVHRSPSLNANHK